MGAGLRRCDERWVGRPAFSRSKRQDRRYDKPDIRRRSWKEFVKPLPDPENRKQAARCMDCGIPFCHDGCPVNNLIPDWKQPRLSRPVAVGAEGAALDQQFSRFTGRVCPAPCEASCTLNIDDKPGHDQDDRMCDCRPWLAGGLDRVGASARANRQAGRGHRLGAGGPRLRAATGARRSLRDLVREERPHRRTAALRHPRLQDGQIAD